MPRENDPLTPAGEGDALESAKIEAAKIEAAKRGTSAAAIIGWFSVGMAVATLGILVGTEIFSRYRFKKRTPYDFYSNAGEAGEFEVGI